MKKKDEKIMKTPGFAWRVSLSIIVSIGWVVFIILWLFFYTSGFTFYQNIGVILATVLIMAAILGAAWASWGIRYGCESEKPQRPASKRKRRRK